MSDAAPDLIAAEAALSRVSSLLLEAAAIRRQRLAQTAGPAEEQMSEQPAVIEKTAGDDQP